MRVKIFTSSGAKWLEEEMNKWLEENEHQVVIISIDPVSVAAAHGLTYVCKIVYQSTDSIEFVDVEE